MMYKKILPVFLLIVLATTLASAGLNPSSKKKQKKDNNPIAGIDAKQPDKVLFDRAMEALKKNRYDVARVTLQTLINTYPDSEYVARAKLAIGDAWYAEGGSTALSQAEIQYKDFIPFLPNMPEAAEAQLKIANIHYQQMEKPDRDYTHAMRAEDEYRQLIMQFPDSKLVPEAKQRLLEVQEVLAERELRVGRFCYLRESYPAAIARLRSVVDRYPLYSQADEALYLLGQAYEGEIAMVRSRKANEVAKARMIQEFTNGAAESYSRIVTRYPLMNRMDDAKARLEALHQPVPRPTKTPVAQNKAEEDSRRETGMFGKVMRNFQKHPDVAQATKDCDPTLVDPQMVSATEVVQKAANAMRGTSTPADNNAVSVETVGKGAPPANQAAPRSDTENPATPVDNSAAPPPAPDPNELKPNVAPDPNELKPNVADESGQALPPPQQVNELAPGTANPATPDTAKTGDAKTSDASSQQPADDTAVSSSKHKKKKG